MANLFYFASYGNNLSFYIAINSKLFCVELYIYDSSKMLNCRVIKAC